jgi:threonine synthase
VGVLQKLAAAGQIDPDERVVAFITGNGLKTLDAVADQEQVAPPLRIKPSLAAFRAALAERAGGGASV